MTGIRHYINLVGRHGTAAAKLITFEEMNFAKTEALVMMKILKSLPEGKLPTDEVGAVNQATLLASRMHTLMVMHRSVVAAAMNNEKAEIVHSGPVVTVLGDNLEIGPVINMSNANPPPTICSEEGSAQ